MIKLMYGNTMIATVMTNRSMSVEDVLDLMGIDMDAVARAEGWDDWDYNELYILSI